ncbi:hypothetical protein ABIE40_001462 [Rhizobium sp. OAE497]|jgi:hypothetical protein
MSAARRRKLALWAKAYVPMQFCRKSARAEVEIVKFRFPFVWLMQ